MGDRVNIIVANVSSLEGIAIYSHWGGYRMPETVSKFIDKAERLDIDYFTRNLLMNVVADGFRGENHQAGVNGFELMQYADEEELRTMLAMFQDQLSYGVSLWIAGDREYPLLVLDPSEQKVYFIDDYKIITIKEALARCYESRSFEEFKGVKSWTEAKELFKTEKTSQLWS
jgi:hypothetical protein